MGIATGASLEAGIVLKDPQDPECLPRAHPIGGVVLTQRAGWQMDILVWRMEESVNKSVSVTLEIAVLVILETSTWGTVGVTMYTNLFL